MNKKFYLVHPRLGILFTDDAGLAEYAVEFGGWRRVSSQEYGKRKAELGRDKHHKVIRHSTGKST